MRLKLGFLLRAVLLLGSFLGLLLLWSSLSPRVEEPSPLGRVRVSPWLPEGAACWGAGRGARQAGCCCAEPSLACLPRRLRARVLLSFLPSFARSLAFSGRGRLRRLLLSLPRLRPVALARPAKGDAGSFGRFLGCGAGKGLPGRASHL